MGLRAILAPTLVGTILLVSASLAGCASSGGSAGGRSEAEAAYSGGDYEAASRLATDEYRRASAAARPRIALTAGLAAHARGDNREAERWLTPLMRDRDREIAGRAQATLGLIALEEGQNEQAAVRLMGASRKLSGDESARAMLYAGDALSALGRSPQATTQYTLGAARAQDSELRQTLQSRLEGGAYTVQLGAFSRRANAEEIASAHEGNAARLGLGEVRLFERPDSQHGTLYVVQVGAFDTRQRAAAARQSLGGVGIVTEAR